MILYIIKTYLYLFIIFCPILNVRRCKKKIRDSGANISICVPLHPFGFNFCGGKLLAMLAFSKEVYEYYYKKNIKLIFKTLSINISYSRIKQYL